MDSLLKVMLSTGAGWVLWLLIGLSVLSVGIIIERAVVISRSGGDPARLAENLKSHLDKGEIDKAVFRLQVVRGVEARIALEGLRAYDKGPDSVAEAITSAKAIQRSLLEQRLGFLGTLGNNAPFIGLFGTVIGIIKAFHDLSVESGGAAKAVMAGISEALVATAMGLFVAIPAVIAFNYFQRRIRALIASVDGLSHLILSELRRQPGPAGAAAIAVAAAEGAPAAKAEEA
ncbi:MAG: MotA/TolQ/ExbB proton channel family protein [Deltaproteobacteria bacterium]|nr:MotA/TolQ/ExbB proton channel family protein [Deltaproteobacteria bacterium]